MKENSPLRRIFAPLASRKIRVAIATVAASYAAQIGLHVSDDMMYTILGVGISLILGIAHEDAGRNISSAVAPPQDSAKPPESLFALGRPGHTFKSVLSRQITRISTRIGT
jgi:hypothetical protein